MNKISKICGQVIGTLFKASAIKATKYINPKFVIKAKRKLYNNKIDKRGNIEIALTIGKPNYKERKFIKDCIKVKESFPIKKIQLKHIKD